MKTNQNASKCDSIADENVKWDREGGFRKRKLKKRERN